MPEPVLTDMNPRLTAAAAETEDAYDKWKAAMELRNELIVAAVDHGMSQRQVAAAARVAVSRVSGILLNAGREELADLS